MSFVPGDETVADGTMAGSIYDAIVELIEPPDALDSSVKKVAASMAIGICEHANPRLLSGDVTGPETSTDNAIPRWNGTAGGAIQDSLVTIDDSGNIALASGKTVDGRDVSADGSTLDAHVGSTANPHSVTAAQAGAVPTARTISTTAPLTGGGSLSANRTIGIAAATTLAAGSMSAADFSKLAGLRNPSRAIFASGGLSRAGSSSYALLDSAAWTEDLDSHGYFNQASNGRFTYGNATSRTFVIRVVGQVSKSVTAEAVRIGVHKNGTDLGKDSSTALTQPPGASQSAGIGLTTSVTLAQNDVLDLRVRSASGTNSIGANVMIEIEEVVS